MQKLNLYGPINDLGYGIFTRGLLRGLTELDTSCHLAPIGQIQITDQFDSSMLNTAISTPWIRSLPSIAVWHEFDLNKFSGKKLIAFPLFETTLFNDSAKNYLSQMDGILVASEWGKSVMIENIGNSVPIFVVPGAADLIETPAVLATNKSNAFTFINVGKFEKRKSTLEAIHAYVSAFHNQPVDTRFIVHCFNPFDNNFKESMLSHLQRLGLSIAKSSSNQSCIVASQGNAIVEVPIGKLSKESLCQLYRHCHVGVFPAKAEGWNLPLMEALQSGLPCIASDYSAHTEYCKDSFGFPTELLLNKLTMNIADDGIWFKGDRGSWAEIDTAELAQKMIDSYNNYNSIMSKFSPNILRNTFSWKNSATKLLEALQSIND